MHCDLLVIGLGYVGLPLAGTDLVIVLQEHRACDLDRVARDAPLILDTRGRIVSPRAEVL